MYIKLSLSNSKNWRRPETVVHKNRERLLKIFELEIYGGAFRSCDKTKICHSTSK